MKIVGIVAEYNPFHNGHQYHIDQSKLQTGAQGVVCVMSGNYVQRGAPALFDKWTRTEMALCGGADLVLELPLPFSLGSAEYFAYGAVSILHQIGIVDFLSFGSENTDLAPLTLAAQRLLDSKTTELIKEYLGEGISFPAARQKALFAGGIEDVSFLSQPNNILGVEYCKSLIRLASHITPVIIPRHLSNYHDNVPTHHITSAQAMRNLLYKSDSTACTPYLPPPVCEIFERLVASGRYFTPDVAFSKAILSAIKKMSAEELAHLPNVTEGLENRIYDVAKGCYELEEFLTRLKTKRYTRTRLNRIAISAYLGLFTTLCPVSPPYARVLGFNSTGQDMLKQMRKTASIPVITKPAHIYRQDQLCRQLFALECRATSLYNLLLSRPTQWEDMTKTPIAAGK